MGRTKNFLDGLNLNEEELNEELYSRADEDYQYQKWLESKEFVEYVNGELDSTRPRNNSSSLPVSFLMLEISIPEFEKISKTEFKSCSFFKVTFNRVGFSS